MQLPPEGGRRVVRSGPPGGVEQLPRRRRKAAEIGEVLAPLTLVDGGIQLEADEVLSRREVDLKPTVGAHCRSSLQTGRQPELRQAGRAGVEP